MAKKNKPVGSDKPLIIVEKDGKAYLGTPIEDIVAINDKPIFVKLKKDKP